MDQRINIFVLDLVCHATATNVPLSGGPAGCKMRSFQAVHWQPWLAGPFDTGKNSCLYGDDYILFYR